MKAINILLREKKDDDAEDAFPSVNFSPKKCNFLPVRVIVKRMKIMLMPQDECWLVMFSRAKQIKLIMIQIAWPYDRQC